MNRTKQRKLKQRLYKLWNSRVRQTARMSNFYKAWKLARTFIGKDFTERHFNHHKISKQFFERAL